MRETRELVDPANTGDLPSMEKGGDSADAIQADASSDRNCSTKISRSNYCSVSVHAFMADDGMCIYGASPATVHSMT